MLGERGKGLEVVEFWEIFVRDLYGGLAIAAMLELLAFLESVS